MNVKNVFSDSFLDRLEEYVGQTVTIYTTSGGMSGWGFTGVLQAINACFVRLTTSIGAPPGCALGSSCCGSKGNRSRRGGYYGNGGFGSYSQLGSVVDIPIDRIAAFVHNAI